MASQDESQTRGGPHLGGGLPPRGLHLGGVCLQGGRVYILLECILVYTMFCSRPSILSKLLEGYRLLPPATKLGQGNIFRSVCQEFCPRGGACVVLFGGHAWFYSGLFGGCMVLFGGACMVLFGGACMVLFGGMHGFILGGVHGFIWGGSVFGIIWGGSMVFSVFSDTMRYGQ